MTKPLFQTRCWPHGCWPNETQLLLLQACLLPERDAALAAFQAWSQRVPFFFVDAGSQKLLLLLYARLRSWNIVYPEMNRLSGLARYSWVRQQLLMQKLIALLRILHTANIDTLLLKGAALNATVYADGARLMSDLDVMAPRAQALRATRVLEAHGWRPQFRNHERLVGITHACHFQHGEHGHLDLHWDLFHGRCLRPPEQRDLWRAGIETRIGHEVTSVLCPADQLLHTCEHGVRYNDVPPFRWLADACLIVRRCGADIDWSRVAHLAQRHQLIQPVRDTLQYIESHLATELPSAAWHELQRLRPTIRSRAEYYLGTRKPIATHHFWQSLPAALFAFRRIRKTTANLRLFDYLALVNNLDPPLRRHLSQLLRVEATSIWNRLRDRWHPVNPQRRFLGMGQIAQHLLEGFHPPEHFETTILRWSQPTASIQLPLRHEPCEITLHLAPVRDWYRDLADNLSIRLNRTTVPAASVRFDNWRVSFRGEPAMLADHDSQRLELRCPSWTKAGSDPRRLGLPLLGVELEFKR